MCGLYCRHPKPRAADPSGVIWIGTNPWCRQATLPPAPRKFPSITTQLLGNLGSKNPNPGSKRRLELRSLIEIRAGIIVIVVFHKGRGTGRPGAPAGFVMRVGVLLSTPSSSSIPSRAPRSVPAGKTGTTTLPLPMDLNRPSRGSPGLQGEMLPWIPGLSGVVPAAGCAQGCQHHLQTRRAPGKLLSTSQAGWVPSSSSTARNPSTLGKVARLP